MVALLDLLSSRGTVAWQVAGTTDRADMDVRLVVDTSGLDSAMRLLVGRGFVATQQDLPSHVELVHPRHGRIVLLPCSFAGDGSGCWIGESGTVTIPAGRFDAVSAVPRLVDVVLPLPGDADPHAGRAMRSRPA